MKLTLPQQDVYFEQLLFPNEPIYNIGAKIAIRGTLSVRRMKEAYVALIDQHDTYRSIIKDRQGQITMEVLPQHHSVLKFIDFSKKENADQKACAFMQNDFKTPFDLQARELLHQFCLIKVEDDFHYLYSVYHHIITDGWGTSLMFQRLVKNYNELSETGAIQSEYPYTYADFVIDDAAYFQSEDFTKDQNYWTDRFQQLPERLFEKIDEKKQGNESRREALYVKRELYNQLAAKAKWCKGSTFHMILGVLFLYFSRKHQNNDFAIGLPVLNRGKSIFKKTVGLFMGVSALRMDIDTESTFAEFVQAIRQQLRQDYRHQRFPLGKLIQELDAFQDKDRLFNITLSYEKQNYADHFKDTKTQVIPLSHESERVALALYIREFDEQEDVKIDFDYNTNYFTKEEIRQVVAHFNELLTAVVENPELALKDFDYLTQSESQKVLYDFNDTEIERVSCQTFIALFNKQFERCPGRLAMSDKSYAYTYHKVDILSNQVAKYIKLRSDIGDRSPIAVLMNRSVHLVTILIGILKTGRPFIPLDPEFPEDRIKHIVEHSGVNCIIADQPYGDLEDEVDQYLNAETILESDIPDITEPPIRIKSSDTAYIIYTSGSTGKPKGVEIRHGSLANFLLSMRHEPGIQSDDVLFSVTTQSFDISLLEFFAPLISGASLYIADKTLLKDPLGVIRKLEVINPSIIQATPSFYQMLFNADWKGNEHLKVLCGGDLLSESLAEKLLDTTGELWNMYGPTETTIWSSIKKIEQAKQASTIGKPIDNTTIYVLDAQMKPLPIGCVGNIYIGGKGLARGYYKNETLSAEQFSPNPFAGRGRIYETGDVGKWNAKGEIEFLGRNDNQVKIRGYRIELGEIETKLNQIDSIENSVVVAKKKKDQEAWLMAFVILKNKATGLSTILEKLRAELPDYMIPYSIIPVKSFPLTPNKKVDRKQLMNYNISKKLTPTLLKRPATKIEEALTNFYQEVLELDSVPEPSDNFFTIGGHSLNAVKLISLISKKLGFQISLKTIFDYPTISNLARFLEGGGAGASLQLKPVAKQANYPITKAQYGIWLAAQRPEKSIAYNMPAVFEIEGTLDLEVLQEATEQLLDKYEILRTNFVERAGKPCQKIRSTAELDFKIDQATFSKAAMSQGIQNFIEQVFDLEKDLLIRFSYFKDDSEQTYLAFCAHHIIMDGWSLEVLINELVQSYQLLTSEVSKGAEQLAFQFKDYAIWQQGVEAKQAQENEVFWNSYLKDYSWTANNFQKKTTATEERLAGTHRVVWDAGQYDQLNILARQSQVSLHTLLISAFNLLLLKTYEKQDLCIGTLNSGRAVERLEHQIGMFVKTLPLRSQLNKGSSFLTFLQQTHENLLKIDAHQDMPQSTQSEVRLDVIFAMQNHKFNYEKIALDNSLHLKSIPLQSAYSRIPLLVNFSIVETTLQGQINYDHSYFDADTIELLFLKYEKLLDKLLAEPTVSLAELQVELSLENKDNIEIGFNF